MLPVIVSVLLQAVIRQVNVVILIGQRVIITAGPQIALFVNVKLIFPGVERPDAEVKLPLPVEHGLLHVLLHYPERVHWPREDKLLDVLDVPEDLYALTLVHSGWFHQPDVVLTVLEGQALFLAATIVNLFEAIHKL
jgi:hypothetical protein